MKISRVLNLVINGMPSIRNHTIWKKSNFEVLNLVINGMPSIQILNLNGGKNYERVLNLVINGMPSIQKKKTLMIMIMIISFKPCYKWNAFNTK